MLTTKEAANVLKLSPYTMARMRCKGGGPTYYKGPKLVYYKQTDLDAWLEPRQRGSTSEY
jgi:hypothetical protein